MFTMFSLSGFTRILPYSGRIELWHLNCVYVNQIFAEQDFYDSFMYLSITIYSRRIADLIDFGFSLGSRYVL